MLAWLICRVTGVIPDPDSVCVERRKQMNAWGWRGCFTHRKTIYGWLQEEAKIRKITIDASLFSIIREAMKIVAMKSERRRFDKKQN